MSLSSQHWRARADEARVHAEQLNDPIAKRTMLKIVAGYERLALLSEERELRETKSRAQSAGNS